MPLVSRRLVHRPFVRGTVLGVIGLALWGILTACGPALADESATSADSQALAPASNVSVSTQTGTAVWAKVPYCTCLAGSATANVVSALKDADLAVSVKEVSPRDGALYFVATYDAATATLAQVSAAIEAGGGEVVAGPP